MSCKNCNTLCAEAGIDGEMCSAWTKKPMTNADKIRAMTDEELEDFLIDVSMFGGVRGLEKIQTWSEWLKEEAPEMVEKSEGRK